MELFKYFSLSSIASHGLLSFTYYKENSQNQVENYDDAWPMDHLFGGHRLFWFPELIFSPHFEAPKSSSSNANEIFLRT